MVRHGGGGYISGRAARVMSENTEKIKKAHIGKIILDKGRNKKNE